jgi:hypothetical protein
MGIFGGPLGIGLVPRLTIKVDADADVELFILPRRGIDTENFTAQA